MQRWALLEQGQRTTPAPLHGVLPVYTTTERAAVCGVLFVERQHGNNLIVPAIYNAVAHLPASWPIQVFAGEALAQANAHALEALLAARRLQLTVLKRGPGLPNPADRNAVLKTTEFWDSVVCDKAVMFDHTTAFCAEPAVPIEAFVGFDYVGAPWKWADPASPFAVGGNGRLSIRSRALMAAVARKFDPKVKPMNEDMWFIEHMQLLGGGGASPNISTRAQGVRWAVEELPFPRPVGVSYGMRTVPKRERAQILQACPGARLFVGYLPGAHWFIGEMEGREEATGCVGGAKTEPACPID